MALSPSSTAPSRMTRTRRTHCSNLGIVKWRGKMDIDGAVAAWQKLLDTNPNYENKDKVLDMIAQARKHAGVMPGTTAKSLPQ